MQSKSWLHSTALKERTTHEELIRSFSVCTWYSLRFLLPKSKPLIWVRPFSHFSASSCLHPVVARSSEAASTTTTNLANRPLFFSTVPVPPILPVLHLCLFVKHEWIKSLALFFPCRFDQTFMVLFFFTLSYTQFYRYATHLIDKGQLTIDALKRAKGKQAYSPATVHRTKQAVKPFFAWYPSPSCFFCCPFFGVRNKNKKHAKSFFVGGRIACFSVRQQILDQLKARWERETKRGDRDNKSCSVLPFPWIIALLPKPRRKNHKTQKTKTKNKKHQGDVWISFTRLKVLYPPFSGL